MILENFKSFHGQHCETTATGSLLQQLGIELSEPMLFGLGEGLGYIFWNMKGMDFPFMGGRIRPDALTENICRNLSVALEVKETSSTKKAWENVTHSLAKGKAVGLKLDCYHLDYFTSKVHFAGHYVSMYGYDDDLAYLNDTHQQGREVQTSLKNLALARNERGPMSSRNRSYTISKANELTDLRIAVQTAITHNANEFLHPPINNLGYKGILKTSTEIKKWFQVSSNLKRDFQTTAMLMEKAGTGGALFRNLYRDFLRQSAGLIDSPQIWQASNQYATIALLWERVAALFHQVGETEDIRYIHEASEILLELSGLERATMEKLK